MDNQLNINNLINSLGNKIYLFDEECTFLNGWHSDKYNFPFLEEGFIGKKVSEIVGRQLSKIVCTAIKETIKTRKSQLIEYQSPFDKIWYRGTFNVVIQSDSDKEFVTMQVQDINDEKILNNKKQLFENIITNNWNAIVFANLKGKIEYINSAANHLYGYSSDELIGKSVDILNSNKSHKTKNIIKELIEKGFWHGEIIELKKDGTTFDALLSIQLINDGNGNPIGFATNSKDITGDIESATQLKNIIKEKEVLLRELHHRVRNNLSIIKGILSLQSYKYTDELVQIFIDEFKNRINAVATVHNTLYSFEDLGHIDFKAFMNDLCVSLRQNAEVHSKNIKLNVIADRYDIPFADTIPLGLIINEVITNCYKHAFKNQKEGKITIQLESNPSHSALKITDDGVGFNFKEKDEDSLGMSLISALSDQIEARFDYNNTNGTEFVLQLS